MQTDPSGSNHILERTLTDHYLSIPQKIWNCSEVVRRIKVAA